VNFTLTASFSMQQAANKPAFDIVQEFVRDQQSERAKKIIEDNGWATIGQGPDAQAVRLSNMVAAVRDWSGNTMIGGDIATIILEQGKTWRWFHRPDFCPEK
jgi:hypothetical protein